MKLWQKILFVAVLIVFVAASITISLLSVSRPTYKYAEQMEVGGEAGVDGWVFASFNGNAGTKTLYIDYVRDKNGNDPDETKPVLGVRAYAVNADENAEELFIGPFVRFIDETSFYNVKKLRRVTVDPENQWYKDVDGVLFTKDGKKLLLYPICYGQRETDKPDEFTYPDTYAVPEGVERIGTFAFLKNKNLRDLTLPSTLKEIGDMAFFDCGRLGAYEYDEQTDALLGTGFTLPDGIEKIGADAFSKCGNIAPGLFLPASLKEIGHHAFFSCSGMKNVFLGAPDENALTLGEAWLPKNVKAGPLWRAATPQYGKTRADCMGLVEDFKTERLEKGREEAKKNG